MNFAHATLHIGTITGYPPPEGSYSHIKLSVNFPQNLPQFSNTILASENMQANFISNYTIDCSNPNKIDELIKDPLKVTLFCTAADGRNQVAGFEFYMFLDAFLESSQTQIESSIIGKKSESGPFDASFAAPTMQISITLDNILLPPEQTDSGAIIRLSVSSLQDLPPVVTQTTLHQDEKLHPFEYTIAFKFPCGRVIQLPNGHFSFDEPNTIDWGNSTRAFLPSDSVVEILGNEIPVQFQIWRTLSEDFAHFHISDDITHLVSGKGSFLCSDFSNPGQVRFSSDIQVIQQDPDEPLIRVPEYPSLADENDSRKSQKSGPKQKATSSRNSAAKKKPKRAVTTKDKKQIKELEGRFPILKQPENGFTSKSTVSIDLMFTHALVSKPLVPHPPRRPRDIFQRKAVAQSNQLTDAAKTTSESVERLFSEVISAQKTRQDTQLSCPDFPDELEPLLNKSPSYHVALEELRNAISFVFSEYAVQHQAQSQQDFENLLAKLPVYVHDIVCHDLPTFFAQTKKPVDHRTFLIEQSEEAVLMCRQNAAAEYLEELLAMDLTDAESWWLYSCIMLKTGNQTRCEECVRRGLTCDPNHLRLSLLFASLLARQQKYLEAIDFLKSAHFNERIVEVVLVILSGLANFPTKSLLEEGENPLIFAAELLDAQDTVFAEQLIAQKQMSEGESATVFYHFGRLQFIIGDLSKAASFLSRSITLENTPESCILLGHVEYERNRYDEAKKWFGEGLAEMFDQDAALRLGFIYLSENEWTQAEGILYQCSPMNASVLLGLGIAAIELGKLKQAEELLNRGTVVNFRHPNIWGYLALVSAKLSRSEEAIHAVEMAKKWSLEDPQIIAKLREANLFGDEVPQPKEPKELPKSTSDEIRDDDDDES